MIKYKRGSLTSFEKYYYTEVPGFATFAEWLWTEYEAVLDIKNDFTLFATNVISFTNPEDEVVFRLRWEIL